MKVESVIYDEAGTIDFKKVKLIKLKFCKYCNKLLSGKQRKFCSKKCNDKQDYRDNADKYIERARVWMINNPKKYRESNDKAVYKFRTKKRKRFNELMMNEYRRNKSKWNSRNRTKIVLKQKRIKTEIEKSCKKCNSKENLSLKFEVYPTKVKEIREAIKDKKIYYICKECRRL